MGFAAHLGSRRIRQNHALEHATMTILAGWIPGLAMSARSYTKGFTIFGDLDPAVVGHACSEALARLRHGEDELAIHPNCGTNFTVGTSVMMLGSLLALNTNNSRRQLAGMLASALTGAAASRRLGAFVQRHITTLPDMADLRVSHVRTRHMRGRRVVEVVTGTL
jgi:hypothetical protein